MSRTTGITVVTLSLVATAVVVAFLWAGDNSSDARPLDPDNLPEFYTGEVLDYNNDGRYDFALFGPVERPTVVAMTNRWATFIENLPSVFLIVVISFAAYQFGRRHRPSLPV